MKKPFTFFSVSFITMMILIANGFALNCFGNETLMAESFDNGGIVPAGWAVETVVAGNMVSFVTSSTWPNGFAPYDGADMVRYNSSEATGGVMRLKKTVPFSTLNYTHVKVDFAWLESSGFAGIYDNVAVQWSTDGITWNTAGAFPRYNPVQGWKIRSVALPSTAQEKPALYIAFLFTSAKGNDCYLDFSHVTASGPIIPATATIGTGTADCNYPFTTFWMDGRTQLLYHADEIIAAGGSPGLISEIGFNISIVNSGVMNGFNIRLMNTSMTTISGWVTSGMTSCYSGTYSLPGPGWQQITLQTPFAYDGTNLLVEICYNNTSYTQYSFCTGSPSPGNIFSFWNDLPSGGGCDFTSNNVLTDRPNIRLVVTPSLCSPSNLSAMAVDNSAHLTWTKPCTDQCFIYDDGSMENAWAFTPSYNRWLGNKFPIADSYSGVLKSFEMLWWSNAAATVQNFQIDVFNMQGTLLGSSQLFQVPIPAPTGYWTLALENDIPVTGPFYAMIHWNAFTGSTHWIGYDENGPNITQGLSYGYDGTVFTPWETFTTAVPGVFCLRACALDNGDLSLAQLLPEANQEDKAVRNNIFATPGMVSSSLGANAIKPTGSDGETDMLSTSGLTGYYIYQNSATTPLQYVTGANTLNTNIPGLTPGTYTYGIKARYDLTSYGFPGQFGESELEGPVTVDISSVPVARVVQNQYIPGSQAYCFDATQTITIGGNNSFFIINNGGSATMIAGQKITYRPDVIVISGGYMHGYIAPAGPYCGGLPPSMVTAVEGENENRVVSTAASCSIYPNPVTETFTLEIFDKAPQTSVLTEIYSMSGVKVLHEAWTNQTKHLFSLSGMPPGLYLMRVTTGKLTETIRIIKQ
jgi:hypothetical protein